MTIVITGANGVVASELMDTSAGFFITSENGTTIAVGNPFAVVKISTITGILSSLVLKYKSILDKQRPSGN